MNTNFPIISLCMIAKDEEDWIGQCIASVRPIVTEIVVVDTGSTDGTIEIVKSFGGNVLHRAWDDDFSAPRNLSIQQASGDWILVLDADEAIDASDLSKIQALTLDRSYCYEFNQRHYSNDVRLSAFQPVRGEYPQWEKHYGGFFESKLCRLFPNREGIHYQGRVHELVEHSIGRIGRHKIFFSPVPIHHYGHTDEVKKKKVKGTLYTPLGNRKVEEDPVSWKAWFEKGVEHNNNGNLEESAKALKRSLELNPQYLDSWVNLGYVLSELSHHTEAEQVLQNAIRMNQRCHEAHCNLGVVYLRTGQFAQAERCFRTATALFPNYVNAVCNLGKALAMQKRPAEAALIYRRALEIFPQSITARLDLGVLYFQSGLFQEAQRYLEEATRVAPGHAHAHYMLAQVLANLNLKNRAKEELTTFINIAALPPNSVQWEDTLRQARAQLQGWS